MQQVDFMASSSIVVNAQPATPAAPTAGCSQHVQQQQAVSNHRLYIQYYTFTPSVVSISVRFSNGYSGTYTFTQTNAAVVLRQRHQVLLLMHNPLHQQLNSRNSYAANMCCNGQFQITGYSIQCYRFHQV
jgi:uncharacterized lipoprotein YajG